MAGVGSTWITPLDGRRADVRVAVKDLIDVAGTPTTAGCRAVADASRPADTDAACLAGLRAEVAAGHAVVSGKANLHELADGISGVNPWFGTPVNPCDPSRVPGGSSSGCATAVGLDQADVAIGTDTAGSVRIPAACCGITALKTTVGRISLTGVWPLAPSLDTVGPMAADVAGLITGMALLEPGFTAGDPPEGPVVRIRPLGADGAPRRAAPWIEQAIDVALRTAGFDVIELVVPGWMDATRATLTILGAEAAEQHGALARDHPDGVGEDVRTALAEGARVGRQALTQARSLGLRWRARLEGEILGRCAALVLPVLDDLPPRLDGDLRNDLTVVWTAAVNLAGLPALSLPVGGAGTGPDRRSAIPAAVQLIGPPGGEAGLLGLGARLEAAVATI